MTTLVPDAGNAVVGVDTAFERTAERGTARLEQRVGRANALPVESESFDFVLSLELLEHLPEDERSMALQELRGREPVRRGLSREPRGRQARLELA